MDMYLFHPSKTSNYLLNTGYLLSPQPFPYCMTYSNTCKLDVKHSTYFRSVLMIMKIPNHFNNTRIYLKPQVNKFLL